MDDFVHLHCHDEFSLLDGLGKPEQYTKIAAEKGFTHLAITNHGNVDGLIKLQKACENNSIVPIMGAELYIVKDINIKEKGEKRKHITFIVQNEIGWNNLLKMITISNIDGFYYKPRIDANTVLEHYEGLVIMTACTSSFITTDWGLELLHKLKEKTESIFLEIMPHDYEDQKELNKLAIELSSKLQLKLVATNDCHYAEEGDSKIQEVLLAIQTKKKWSDPDRWKFDITDLYLKTKREMAKAFKKQGILAPARYITALNNTVEIAKLCENFRIREQEVILPQVPKFAGKEDEKVLMQLCHEELRNRKLQYESKYLDRFNHEYDIISKQGFSRYFLIVYDLVRWCKENDIMVGPGRGSAGGSLVCYLLGITSVDPIKFNLVFARFISPARIDLPDIDIDFEDIKRPLVRKYLEDTYGKWSVAGVSTFSSMKGKGSIRDVSRVFNIPLTDVGKACDSIVTRSGGDVRSDYSIKDAFSTFEDGKRFKKKYPEVTRIACKIEGQIRGKGQHAAAIIVADEDLREGKRIAYVRGKGGEPTVNWDKHDIEHVGLMKLDALGLNALTVLNHTRKAVKNNHGVDIIFEEIPLDEKKCFEEFSKGNNTGCFQVGSLGLKRFCQQIGVDNFMMLVHASSLYRPGTLRSGMTTEFVRRKKGEVKWEHKHEAIKELTDFTYGIILYQEQVMQFMYDLAGLGWRTADTVRKVISKSQGVDQFQKFKKDFADGCEAKNTLSRKEAEILWDELASFGSYGFNLSHAVEYSMITYWDMWCKIHYPEEFICASLTYGSDNKKEDLIEEAIRLQMDVRPPKVGISKSHEWIISDGKLYVPFIEIKGFGDKTSRSAEKYEEEKFFEDTKKKLPKRFVNILEEINAFKDIEINDDEADRIRKFFSFSLCKDPARKIKPVMEKIGIEFTNIKDVNFNKIDKEYKYFFGKMTEIKFGYRAKLDNVQKKQTVADQADNLGGVYGNYKDESDFCMLVFGSEIYSKKKELVEHCTDKYIIVKGNVPSRAGSIQCADAWFEDELLAGELDGLKMKAAKSKRFINRDLADCINCSLSDECDHPILPSKGRYNIMIIGEAPGKDEDTKGKGFIGQAGEVLWKELNKYGYERINFHVTNVVKCFPSKTKTPNKRHINSCSKWLIEEIERIQPCLILALGNTCIKFFTEADAGIMNKCGITEWNYDYKTWISWCTHPASVLYNSENRNLFEEGIKNFARNVKNIGGI